MFTDNAVYQFFSFGDDHLMSTPELVPHCVATCIKNEKDKVAHVQQRSCISPCVFLTIILLLRGLLSQTDLFNSACW